VRQVDAIAAFNRELLGIALRLKKNLFFLEEKVRLRRLIVSDNVAPARQLSDAFSFLCCICASKEQASRAGDDKGRELAT